MKMNLALISLFVVVGSTECFIQALSSWKKSYDYGVAPYDKIRADVMKIYYDYVYFYINANSIPSYKIGPWAANPNTARAQNFTLIFPFNPVVQTGTKTATGLGVIGLFTNGVAMYSAWDGFRVNTVWQRNAWVFEGVSFDSCLGHPDQRGVYHNHANPSCLYSTQSTTSHSPIIGWALDGFPIYGPYGYSNPTNSGSPIKRILPSYVTRSYPDNKRTTLANGTVLITIQQGPDVSSKYPIGSFLQDYEYKEGSGDLDQYNGRYCNTPDYPFGTYAYFIAMDESGQPVYPYTIGPYYYGKVGSLNTYQTIPSSATPYFNID